MLKPIGIVLRVFINVDIQLLNIYPFPFRNFIFIRVGSSFKKAKVNMVNLVLN